MSRLSSTALFLFGCAVASPALAQDSDTTSETPGEEFILDEGRTFTDGATSITVIGDRLGADQTNASVTLIGEADLRRAQNGPLAETLARTAGVGVTRNGGIGGFTGVRIRGADAEQTLVVIDGVRVGDPSSPGGGFDFANLMLGGIDTVEILRGANSLAWGSEAIGGVIAITGVRPRVFAMHPYDARATAEYGSFDSKRMNGQLRLRAPGSSTIGFGGGYARTDGYSSAAGGSEADGYRQWTGNVRTLTQLSGTMALQLFGMLTDSRTELDGYAAPLFTFGDTAEYQDSREHYAGAVLEHVPDEPSGDSGFSHKLSFGFADINRDSFDPAVSSDPAFRARGRSERIAYALDWLPVGTYGGGWNRDDLRVRAGFEREWIGARTASAFGSDRGRTATTSTWAMILGKPVDALSLTAGLRHDRHRDFGGATSIAADAGYKINTAWTVRASYREGFKAPTLFQLSADPFAYGNPALAPERARAWEIGSRWSSHDWQVDIALFRRDSRNLIDFTPCTGTAADPAICQSGTRPFGTYANIGRARAQGVEVSASVDITDNLKLDGNYSHLATRDRSPGSALLGRQLARRPRNLVNAELIWTDATTSPAPELSLALRYVGGSFDDRANRTRLDDHVLVDVRGRYPLSDRISLFARAENLFDAQYQTVAGYGTAGRSVFAGVEWTY